MLKKWSHEKIPGFRLPVTVAASLVLVFGILSTPLAAREPIETVRPNYNIMMIAHRGTARYAPENTLPAIQKAIDAGFDYVEIDVRFTKDGVPVLLHDPKLDRTTNGSGPLSDYTLAEIKKLDAGYPEHFDDKFKGTQIPTFEEALQLMQGKINLYLDQKEMPTPIIMELLKKYGFFPDNMIIVAGGEKGEKFMEMDPASPIMPSISSIESVEKAIEQFPGIRAFNSSEQTLTPEQVDEAHKYGIMVFTNTLGWGDSETFMRHVMDLGSDALQTDSPRVLLKTKKKVKKEQEKE